MLFYLKFPRERSACSETAFSMRRRQRRLRQWLRHERLSVAMALAEATHHTAPRRQRPGPGLGTRSTTRHGDRRFSRPHKRRQGASGTTRFGAWSPCLRGRGPSRHEAVQRHQGSIVKDPLALQGLDDPVPHDDSTVSLFLLQALRQDHREKKAMEAKAM